MGAKQGARSLRLDAESKGYLEHAHTTWQKHGRSKKWIQQRMTGQEIRNKLTAGQILLG